MNIYLVLQNLDEQTEADLTRNHIIKNHLSPKGALIYIKKGPSQDSMGIANNLLGRKMEVTDPGQDCAARPSKGGALDLCGPVVYRL